MHTRIHAHSLSMPRPFTSPLKHVQTFPANAAFDVLSQLKALGYSNNASGSGGHNSLVPVVSEAEYWRALEEDVGGVRTMLCERYGQDAPCLEPPHDAASMHRTRQLCGIR